MEITLDKPREQFVIKSHNSVSVMGFKRVYEQGRELLRRLSKKVSGLPPLLESEIGTTKQFEQFNGLMAQYALMGDQATWFDSFTPLKVQRILETARRTGAILRIFRGDTSTGLDWLAEDETLGRVGRSQGPMCFPLLCPVGDDGAGVILSSQIVRIIDVTAGQELYRHPTYHLPELKISEEAFEHFSHCVETTKDGQRDVVSRFTSLSHAAHWVAYVSGESFDIRK